MLTKRKTSFTLCSATRKPQGEKQGSYLEVNICIERNTSKEESKHGHAPDGRRFARAQSHKALHFYRYLHSQASICEHLTRRVPRSSGWRWRFEE